MVSVFLEQFGMRSILNKDKKFTNMETELQATNITLKKQSLTGISEISAKIRHEMSPEIIFYLLL